MIGYFEQGQSIEDACIQRYGSLTFLPKFLVDNNLTYTQEVTAGSTYVYDANYGDSSIKSEYNRKGIKVNNFYKAETPVTLSGLIASRGVNTFSTNNTGITYNSVFTSNYGTINMYAKLGNGNVVGVTSGGYFVNLTTGAVQEIDSSFGMLCICVDGSDIYVGDDYETIWHNSTGGIGTWSSYASLEIGYAINALLVTSFNSDLLAFTDYGVWSYTLSDYITTTLEAKTGVELAGYIYTSDSDGNVLRTESEDDVSLWIDLWAVSTASIICLISDSTYFYLNYRSGPGQYGISRIRISDGQETDVIINNEAVTALEINNGRLYVGTTTGKLFYSDDFTNFEQSIITPASDQIKTAKWIG